MIGFGLVNYVVDEQLIVIVDGAEADFAAPPYQVFEANVLRVGQLTKGFEPGEQRCQKQGKGSQTLLAVDHPKEVSGFLKQKMPEVVRASGIAGSVLFQI